MSLPQKDRRTRALTPVRTGSLTSPRGGYTLHGSSGGVVQTTRPGHFLQHTFRIREPLV